MFFEESCTTLGIIPQKRFEPHLHYHAEVIFSLKGSFLAIVNGESIVVEEGCGVIVFPYQLHEYDEIDSERALVMLISPDNNRKLLKCLTDELPRSALIPRHSRNAGLYRVHKIT